MQASHIQHNTNSGHHYLYEIFHFYYFKCHCAARRHNLHNENPEGKSECTLWLNFTCQTHKVASEAFHISLEVFYSVSQRGHSSLTHWLSLYPWEDSASLRSYYIPKHKWYEHQEKEIQRTDVCAASNRFASDWCELFGPNIRTYFTPSAAIARNTFSSVFPSRTAMITTQ